MRKQIRLFLLIIISLVFIPLNVFADSSEYTIDKYNIDIKVNKDNTFDITETITANFKVKKHGIYRTIPLKNIIERNDGTTSTNHAKVSNIKINEEYTKSRENNNIKLQIGNENKLLTGVQEYVISYTYDIGKDPLKDKDELYYNIIGTGWDTTISNVTFTITMPEEFDSSKLGFTYGSKGSTETTDIEYHVDGNIITGSYNGTLNSGEALTVRCELEEGYFVVKTNYMSYIPYILPIVFLIISFVLWLIFGKDDTVVETVEFYPPKGLNSLEVGYLYRGNAVNKDVTSLLIYLANQGYIKITEIEEKVLFSSKKEFKLTRLKDYDGDNINERLFLNGLFKKKSTISISNIFNKNREEVTPTYATEVTSSDLYDNFYITMQEILKNTNNKDNKNKIFEKYSTNKIILLVIMVIASFCAITIPAFVEDGSTDMLLFGLLFPGIGLTVLVTMLGNENISTKTFGTVFGLFFGGVPWLFIVLPVINTDKIFLIGYLVGIVCNTLMLILIKIMPKRTQYGNEILGKLKGFKNFLETAEKEKLEAMVSENPTYFFDILPYTYVLGVSDKWIKKFETIALKAPDWYDSPYGFNTIAFGQFMNSTMDKANNVMTSSPSSGSSGGGSSGGGSGGGGGGSW